MTGADGQWCLSALPAICFTPSDGFPFWELLASAILTGTVTWLTIWASIAGARRETTRTIRAGVLAETRARRERLQVAQAEAEVETKRQRIGLAAALSRAVHLVSSVRELPSDDRTRISVEAEWSALRVSFATATPAGADELYEFADLRIEAAMTAGDAPSIEFVAELLKHVKRTTFAEDVSKAATEWASSGALPSSAIEELKVLRVDRLRRAKAQNEEILSTLRRLAARQPSRSDAQPETDSPPT